MDPVCIVIPCYNEALRFPSDDFLTFAGRYPETTFCLVNDGSSDGTEALLESLRKRMPDRILLCSMPVNKGKAEAVRTGMLAAMKRFPSGYFGYFDADLSTPLEEVFHLQRYFRQMPSLLFCFGSRMAIVGTTIERRLYRHLIGRVIATFISNLLHLVVYDTQCGAKLFRRDLAEKVFLQSFLSRWLFDVEIMARVIGMYGRKKIGDILLEVPVNQWIDKGGSKISWSYGFRVFLDLCRIHLKYRADLTRSPRGKTG